MSRWTESFENHAFHDDWSEIVKSLDELIVDDETVETSVAEIARFKKVVTYIESLLQACDPELVPSDTWAKFQSQAKLCLQQVVAYKNDRGIARITTANTNLDNLLTYIRPYHVVTGKAAKAASSSFSAYAKTIDSSLSSFQGSAKIILSEIDENKQQAIQGSTEIDSVKSKINQLQTDYFDDSESESLSTKISKLKYELDEIYEEVKKYKSDLFGDDDDTESISHTVSLALSNASSDSEKINRLLGSVENKLSEFRLYYEDVFGIENADGKAEGGLKKEIENRQIQLDDFKKKHEEKYKALNDEIEGLLPGATSAGLANAYFKMKESFNEPLENYSTLFYFSICGLVLVSLISITQEVSWTYIKFVEITDYKQLFFGFFYKLPIVLPVLWLALFAAKRRSETSRLQQEYAHKEATAKSYQSFKTQVDALNRPDSELMAKLIDSAIDTVSRNSSDTLDKKHDEKLPLENGIDLFLKNAEKMKNLFKT